MNDRPGPVGEVGPAGPDSTVVGPDGDQGPTGDQGPIGDTGDQGPQGDPGMTGIDGITGIIGVKGRTGDTGIQGPRGPSAERPIGIQFYNDGFMLTYPVPITVKYLFTKDSQGRILGLTNVTTSEVATAGYHSGNRP